MGDKHISVEIKYMFYKTMLDYCRDDIRRFKLLLEKARESDPIAIAELGLSVDKGSKVLGEYIDAYKIGVSQLKNLASYPGAKDISDICEVLASHMQNLKDLTEN